MSSALSVAEIGAYCRSVEGHLTRANGGHLVRVVGPGFELVRQWALDGVPLSVVYRAIDDKAERHREGGSRHPLRIEFCEADVRQAFEHWRRAVGVGRGRDADGDEAAPEPGDEAIAGARRPSLARHLDRVIDRLARVSGRLDLPETLRAAVADRLAEVTALREEARGARGERKAAIVGRLAPVDAQLIAAARDVAGAPLLDALQREAERDLAPYRARITAGDWQRAVDVTVDRLLRERFGLPTADLE